MWIRLLAEGWTQTDLAHALDTGSGQTSHWLYGERRPGRRAAETIRERLGISPPLWDQEPVEPFTPPGVAQNAAEVAP